MKPILCQSSKLGVWGWMKFSRRCLCSQYLSHTRAWHSAFPWSFLRRNMPESHYLLSLHSFLKVKLLTVCCLVCLTYQKAQLQLRNLMIFKSPLTVYCIWLLDMMQDWDKLRHSQHTQATGIWIPTPRTHLSPLYQSPLIAVFGSLASNPSSRLSWAEEMPHGGGSLHGHEDLSFNPQHAMKSQVCAHLWT